MSQPKRQNALRRDLNQLLSPQLKRLNREATTIARKHSLLKPGEKMIIDGQVTVTITGSRTPTITLSPLPGPSARIDENSTRNLTARDWKRLRNIYWGHHNIRSKIIELAEIHGNIVTCAQLRPYSDSTMASMHKSINTAFEKMGLPYRLGVTEPNSIEYRGKENRDKRPYSLYKIKTQE